MHDFFVRDNRMYGPKRTVPAASHNDAADTMVRTDRGDYTMLATRDEAACLGIAVTGLGRTEYFTRQNVHV